MKITIVLPHPPANLRPNNRAHWAKKAQAVKVSRRLAKVRAIVALAMQPPPRWRNAKVRIVWRCTRRIHPDPDNIVASCKAYFDGLADAGVVENDRGLWPERPVIETGAHWPELVLTVEEDI